MYADKYENFFLHITAGRSRFIEFASFTNTALQAGDLPTLLADLATPFEEALTTFVKGVAARTTDQGAVQGGTQTEDAVWAEFKTFIQATDKKFIQPAFFNDPAALNAYYPYKLRGLTQAPKKLRLPRLLAYTDALQSYNKPIRTAAWAQATALLTRYRAATALKEHAEGSVQTIIAALDPSYLALCAQLWKVHTTALYVYSDTPRLAAALFHYTLLPKTYTKPKPKLPAVD